MDYAEKCEFDADETVVFESNSVMRETGRRFYDNFNNWLVLTNKSLIFVEGDLFARYKSHKKYPLDELLKDGPIRAHLTTSDRSPSAIQLCIHDKVWKLCFSSGPEAQQWIDHFDALTAE